MVWKFRWDNISNNVLAKQGERVLGFVIALVIWWIVALFHDLVPTPLKTLIVGMRIAQHTPELSVLGGTAGKPGILDDLLWTTIRTLVGTLTGFVAGILLGVTMGWSRVVRDFFNPVIELLRVAPPLAYVPFFIIWFGLTNFAFVLLIGFVTFLLIVVNTYEATQNVPAKYREFARTLGASERKTYFSIVLPGMEPELIGGIRVALGLAWGITVIAELMGAQIGMGVKFTTWLTYHAAPKIIAGILAISGLAVLTDRLVTIYLRQRTMWSRSSNHK